MTQDNWPSYRNHWDVHALRVGPNTAVTGLGDSYNDVVGSVIDVIAPRQVSVVFDIGCGAGLTYPLIKERWPTVDYTGLDVSPVMIAHCQQLFPDARWIVVDGPELPEGKRADLIICHSVMTHIYPDDARKYLDLIHDCLTKHGRASISIHIDCKAGWAGNVGRIDYRPSFFEQMLDHAGLEIVTIIDNRQRTYGVKRAE